MVDSVSQWAGSTLLQSQNYATKTTTAAQGQSVQQSFSQFTAKSAKSSSTQDVFDQLDKVIDQGKSLVKQSAGSINLASSGSTNADLPRGSLIDIVV